MNRDLPAKYYLDHFKEFISFITQYCNAVLEPEHLNYLNTIDALDEDAQCLYVRILNRKGMVVKKNTLKYEEIDDITASLTQLEQNKLIGPITKNYFQPSIESLTKPELIQLVQNYLLKVPQDTLAKSIPIKSANKAKWISWILRNIEFEQIMHNESLTGLLVNYEWNKFEYLLFLYFGNLKGKLNQFSLRDMGIMGTRKNQVQNEVRFQELSHAKTAYFYAKKNHDIQLWSDSELQNAGESIDKYPIAEGNQAIKSFDGFSFHLGKSLIPLNMDLALRVLSLSQDPRAIEKRVREWYKLGQTEQVKSELEKIIDDPASEHLFLFAIDFLDRKFNNKRTSILTDVLRNSPPAITMDEAFINDVEIGVINHYQRNQIQAIRTENQPWRALFALTFWPELFAHPKTGLCNEFDYVPKVLKENCFYATVPQEIENRLQKFTDTVALQTWLTQQWTTHYGKSNGIFYWHSDLLSVLLTLVTNSNIKAIKQHLLDMSKHYRELNDGYPDIAVVENQKLRFEEIKAPGDQLRRNQLVVIQKLKRLGWDVKLQTVEWKLNPNQPYVVVDIETTGGGQGHHRITEVGMVKVVDGIIVEEWQSLINPQRHIPKYITELTGISNEMVAHSPLFSEVADEIKAFCDGCIFVAHNVNFDYGFIKQEFERLDQLFRLPKLCTVRLAKRHLPGHESYSLGKLCNDLDIELENHHRALDDAKAAAHILIMVNTIRTNLHS